MTRAKNQEERFWDKVDRTDGPDACWAWLAGKDKYGNGNVKYKGKATQARRVAYELEFGQIPPGLVIRVGRDCKPPCVNPTHLTALTKSESSRLNGESQLSTEELFWEKVDRTGGPDACWVWLARKKEYGAGTFRYNGRATPARRVAYELTFGQIPAGLVIRVGRDCKPPCVNPAHLLTLTKSESGRLSGQHQLKECKKGHPFTEETTSYKHGKKYCVICRMDWLEAAIARLSEGPAVVLDYSFPERDPVYPEVWGDRQPVIGGRVVDEKFERRFWRKVDRSGGAESCWPWVGARDPNGYGIFDVFNDKDGKKRTQAHIVGYQIMIGPIPERHVIDHFRCANKPCCNPAHLEPVTNEENVRRARRRKPYCVHGHPHNQENSHITTSGGRVCRACKYLGELRQLRRSQSGAGPVRKLTRAERFWAKVDQSGGPDVCWPWLGRSRDAAGYGRFSGKNAHRLAWELANERPIPEGQTIDHTCRNNDCCNPKHLEPVSVEENSRRAAPFRPSRGQPTEVRFWAQADTSEGPTSCWVWKGESIILWDSEHRKTVNARHFIYQLKVGTVPAGRWIRARCGNPNCVNYRHLTLAQGITAQMRGKPAPSPKQLAFTLT